MSISHIPVTTRYILWGKAGGRCEYDGCNQPLYYDDLTKSEFNSAYIAHIIADSPDGPRGDKILSKKYKDALANLMLMCDVHHRLIDIEDVVGHTVERLQVMKKEHEERIEIQTSLKKDKRTHIILYGEKIGEHDSSLTIQQVFEALENERYPYSLNPVELGVKNLWQTDKNEKYWLNQEEELINLFKARVDFIKRTSEIQHYSIFALAPQPLLIKLGTLLSDLYPADVYQKHREPSTWLWQGTSEIDEYIVIEPEDKSKPPVLKIALSANIIDERIKNVLDDDCSIWTITINNPNNDFLKTRELLSKFRKVTREVLNKIHTAQTSPRPFHIFPAMPVSAAVEFGRVWMPKADLSLIIYDQNSARNGFNKTLEIKNEGNQ